jgi:molybdopterin-dependent oxidoreductase alpha subunit
VTQERDQDPTTTYYDHPTGGWGSLKSVLGHATQNRIRLGVLDTLRRQNKPGGYMCSSCAWAKPPSPHLAEFCENGAKATIWDLTPKRCGPDFFAKHTLAELRTWCDHDLEAAGRLTHPLRYDPASDRYVRAAWGQAFTAIGQALQGLDPKSTVFYASGKASLEASYLYALFARLYGHNNLPDSSNMCHETTSVALQRTIGAPVGTCVLEDFEHCDLMLFFGQNTGSNSPRFLHPIQQAVKRGCKIVTFNPVRERGLVEFMNPQNPAEMLTGRATPISDLYLQLRPGGDIAAIAGICKHLFDRGALDRDFIAQHCHDFDAFEGWIRDLSWDRIEATCGLSRTDLIEVAELYARSKRVIGVYGMGLTQHVHGGDSVGMLVNLLLMGGNIGRKGAGICPVRGHSNVQGQRTVGISEKPELVPLDRQEKQFRFTAPRDKGMNTVEACEGILAGTVKAFLSLGGNFVRAIPERSAMEDAWTRMRLTVQIATKLNRSHLINGEVAYLLPCLGRSEEDMQAGGPQTVTMEDSLSCIHGSIGKRSPASEHLLSELAIVAGIAKATLPPNPHVRWDEWLGDYGKVRDLIEESYPDMFADFNERMFTPGGFHKGNAARERIWMTDSGKAEFTVPETLSACGFEDAPGRYRLITLRSNDQFNTTIYGYSDRMRGIHGTRDVLLINPGEIRRAGLQEGQRVKLLSDAEDGIHREVGGLTVTPFSLPDGCVAGYYPEMNPLIALSHHDRLSQTPAAKSVPVRIEAEAVSA